MSANDNFLESENCTKFSMVKHAHDLCYKLPSFLPKFDELFAEID